MRAAGPAFPRDCHVPLDRRQGRPGRDDCPCQRGVTTGAVVGTRKSPLPTGAPADKRRTVSESQADQPASDPPQNPAGVFATTHWSVVLTAGREGSPGAQLALEQLCRVYWYPLYAHARRRGHDHHRAEDLTQEFFARLLDQQWLSAVAPQKGRFRSFLLGALDHFLANDWRHGRALKRGGRQKIVSLDEAQFGEERFARETLPTGAPERAFDRLWAATVLEQAMTCLKGEYVARGKSAHFQDWVVFLGREATAADCQASAKRLGMSAGAVTVAVHRFRERYGQLLRDTVAQTVDDGSSVDEELRYLFELLNA